MRKFTQTGLMLSGGDYFFGSDEKAAEQMRAGNTATHHHPSQKFCLFRNPTMLYHVAFV